MFFLSLALDILVQPVVECNQWGSAGMPGERSNTYGEPDGYGDSAKIP